MNCRRQSLQYEPFILGDLEVASKDVRCHRAGVFQRGDLARNVLLHRQQGRHHDQHQDHAEAKPVDQRDHRRFQELRLLRALVEERRETEHGGKRCQQHRPQPVRRPVDYRGDQPAFHPLQP